MDIFDDATPRYTGMMAQQQATSGLLSGLFGSLVDGTVPSYRSVDGRRVSAQSSASWWSALSLTPSYKTASAASTASAAPSDEDALGCDGSSDDPDASGDSDPAPTCVCTTENATQVVILE